MSRIAACRWVLSALFYPAARAALFGAGPASPENGTTFGYATSCWRWPFNFHRGQTRRTLPRERNLRRGAEYVLLRYNSVLCETSRSSFRYSLLQTPTRMKRLLTAIQASLHRNDLDWASDSYWLCQHAYVQCSSFSITISDGNVNGFATYRP